MEGSIRHYDYTVAHLVPYIKVIACRPKMA